jgi:hypothetical protein
MIELLTLTPYLTNHSFNLFAAAWPKVGLEGPQNTSNLRPLIKSGLPAVASALTEGPIWTPEMCPSDFSEATHRPFFVHAQGQLNYRRTI